MNRELAAYIAGLVEVGGWIGTRDGQPGIQVTAPREVCLKLQRRTGMGNVYGKPGSAGMWSWSVQDKDSVVLLLNTIAPQLSKVRQYEASQVVFGAYDDGRPAR